MSLNTRIEISAAMGLVAASIFWGFIEPARFLPGLAAGLLCAGTSFVSLYLTYVRGSKWMQSTALEPGEHQARNAIALVVLGAMAGWCYFTWESGNKPLAASISIFFIVGVAYFLIAEFRRRRNR